jgi:hypothetical protein
MRALLRGVKRGVTMGAVVLILSGCATTGLSPREPVTGQAAGGRGSATAGVPTYTTYIYSLYNTADAPSAPAARAALHLPARIAVAQIGEVAPPAGMLEALRKETGLVAAVEPMPGVFDGEGAVPAATTENLSPTQRLARAQTQRMRRYARDLGMDYLFLFGGTIDYDSNATGLSVMDLTIVGAFVVPSKEIVAAGRTSGALVDVNSGHLVRLVTADAQGKHLASTAAREGDQEKMLHAMRQDLAGKLTARLIEQLKSS